ncbi:hypothetical protein [Geodermatophilus amargosae]|uniref:hypothetical protein n=1 Tax=Geodermatophilus amargosae TaxID=1296565 RepID=UPI0034DE64E2
MRASHVATATAIAVAAFTAGLTAASALHRRAGRSVPTAAVGTAPEQVPTVVEQDAVVLAFPRPVPAPEPAERPAATPTRCGDSGGVTKAGAPCGARATSGGRCHHHPLAA